MAPRGLWIVNHPLLALFVGLGVLTAVVELGPILAAIAGPVILLTWASRRRAQRK